MAGLELLKITGFTNESFTQQLSSGTYTVMINPESIKWNRKVDYNAKQTQNSSSTSQTYKSTPYADLSFDIVIDCTGIVDSKRTKMSDEIKKIERIVYTYNGDIHRPNYVQVQWGKNINFNSVLKSFDTTYTLFRPDGTPLRAKISLSFGEYISPKKVQKLEKKNSPDMTHLVTVVEGDNLPQLCHRIWNDSSFYVAVAKYNGLNKFRKLKSGKELIFPPIVQPN
jgi:hypothetical protein